VIERPSFMVVTVATFLHRYLNACDPEISQKNIDLTAPWACV